MASHATITGTKRVGLKAKLCPAAPEKRMANRGRATFAKRQKEIARQERAREKASRRVERKETKVKVEREGSDDPDIAGITPGPQPLPYELLEGDFEPAIETEDEQDQESQ